MTGLFQQLAQRMSQGGLPQQAPKTGGAVGAVMPPQIANGMWARLTQQQPQQGPVQGAFPQPPQGLPGQAAPPGPPPQPQGPPSPQATPNPHAQVPPAAQRFANAQKIQEAYANNWQPNPVLLRAMLGRNS